MKIRMDYITNSSSSSYIIAYRNLPKFDEETIAKYPFLKNYGSLIEKVLFTEGDNETTEGEVARTKEEYDKNFVDCYGWREHDTIESIIDGDGYLTDRYNKAIEYLNKGFNILTKYVDYNDTYCMNLINELAEDKENFVILEDE